MIGKFYLPKEDFQEYPDVEKARAFAMQAHEGQLYGVHAYIYHLDQVAYYAKDFGEKAVILAYLHDVLEDTAFTVDAIKLSFGEEILRNVQLLTDPYGETRADRKSALHSKLAAADESLHLALIVKAADRVANVRESLATGQRRMWNQYFAEYSEFKKTAYRPELCERLWKILDVLMEEDAFEHFRYEV